MSTQENIRNALTTLLTKNARICIVGTGAGSTFLSTLWSIPGISAVLAGATFPYAREETIDYLRFEPKGYCNERTAMALAMEAYYRAYKFDGPPAIGIGLSATVASKEIHRGSHRVWVASFSDAGAKLYYGDLVKGAGEVKRQLDGLTCDSLATAAVLETVGEPLFIDFPKDSTGALNLNNFFCSDAGDLPMELMKEHPFFSSTGTKADKFPLDSYVKLGGAQLPGSFNPPHWGHFGIADAFTESQHGSPVAFVIEASPPHKKAVTVLSMLQRAKLLKGRDVMFTWGTSKYLDKAKLFPGLMMILGMDSFKRMLEPEWGISVEELQQGFWEAKTALYVPDRMVDGKFTTLDDLSYMAGFPCVRLKCRFDVSSTEIRAEHTTTA